MPNNVQICSCCFVYSIVLLKFLLFKVWQEFVFVHYVHSTGIKLVENIVSFRCQLLPCATIVIIRRFAVWPTTASTCGERTFPLHLAQGSGSALIRVAGSRSAFKIRIRIRVYESHFFKNICKNSFLTFFLKNSKDSSLMCVKYNNSRHLPGWSTE